MDGSFCDDAIIAVGPLDGKNYRDDIYPAYKQTATRVKGRKDKIAHFYEAKDYLYGLPNVLVADNEEADDLIGILANQTEDAVIISSDKDLDQLPGRHWNPGILLKTRTPVLYEQSLEAANRFFLKQLVMGDAVDNIPGLPSIGPVKGEAFCSGYDSYQALALGVVELYKTYYKNEWENYFLSNGKMLYLRRKSYENFTIPLFYERFGT
jgi:DNA polymerase-1